MTRVTRWLVVLGAVAAAVPGIVLAPRLAPLAVETIPPEPVAWRVPPPLSASLARPLFDAGGGMAAAGPADAPVVVGIAGRIGRDAVAMVRGGDGGVRVLSPGEAIDGWMLRSVAIDAAYFTRGAQTARVPLGGE